MKRAIFSGVTLTMIATVLVLLGMGRPIRYYGPTPRLNGNIAMDIVYKEAKLENKIKAVKFY